MPTFTSSTGITLADDATEQQSLVVSGVLGTITSVSVTITGLSHPFLTGLDFLLVGPNGTANLEFWSDVLAFNVLNATFTVADGGAQPFTGVSGATYKPTDFSPS